MVIDAGVNTGTELAFELIPDGKLDKSPTEYLNFFSTNLMVSSLTGPISNIGDCGNLGTDSGMKNLREYDIMDHRNEKYYVLVREELDEFMDAINIVEQAGAVIDLIYFALGALVKMRIEPNELFKQIIMQKKTMKQNSWENPYK